MSEPRDLRVLFVVAGTLFVAWMCFLAWRIGLDISALKRFLAGIPNPPHLVGWTSFSLKIGAAIWFAPVAGAMSIVTFASGRWGLWPKCLAICGLAAATWVLFMMLNVGLYSPVEWVMEKVI